MADQGGMGKGLARAGVAASAFLMFVCGWFAMRSDDWRVTVGLTLLAGVAALVAQAFSRRAR
ncbi:MAG: hypothetical protein HZB56_20405 [Deltaproteobacteria bacterium]|nr:hypothetical protein [Deltaproteobacteria bacterium]